MSQSEHGSSGKSTLPAQSTCKKCGQTIYWHTSQRTGKFYSTNSENRGDFHSRTCGSASTPKLEADTCSFEPTVQERLTALEKRMDAHERREQEQRGSQPIDDSDVPF